jgi:hypothetical protein
MRRKHISIRRWKARLKLGIWIPGMVMFAYDLKAPDGYTLVPHPNPNLDFYRAVPTSENAK